MIVGLGKSGMSCARYFVRHGIPFAAMDASPAPVYLDELRELAPDAPFMVMDRKALLEASEIVLSPGVPRDSAEIREAMESGIPVTGDVAMFGELADAPFVSITGSNGKSTVTALVGEMAARAGVNAGIGGNIGVPCLDLLEQGFEVFVIELSSYQLETADHLHSKVAVVLNLSPDHLDRYADVESYYSTKAAVYPGAECAVVNRDLDYPFDLSHASRVISFGSNAPTSADDFGLLAQGDEMFFAKGGVNLLATSAMRLRGAHNYQNALAALAIGDALDWDMSAMLEALREFPGLPHRCEWIATIDGVEYINDSKATNTGSTIAAVNGLAGPGKNIVLILGGIGKGADFSVLSDAVSRHVRAVYLYGRDRDLIAAQLPEVESHVFETLDEVVMAIRESVTGGDLVLLAPGCASQDQFANFEARGDAFRTLVTQRGAS